MYGIPRFLLEIPGFLLQRSKNLWLNVGGSKDSVLGFLDSSQKFVRNSHPVADFSVKMAACLSSCSQCSVTPRRSPRLLPIGGSRIPGLINYSLIMDVTTCFCVNIVETTACPYLDKYLHSISVIIIIP